MNAKTWKITFLILNSKKRFEEYMPEIASTEWIYTRRLVMFLAYCSRYDFKEMWFNNTLGNIGMEQNAEIRKIFSGFHD